MLAAPRGLPAAKRRSRAAPDEETLPEFFQNGETFGLGFFLFLFLIAFRVSPHFGLRELSQARTQRAQLRPRAALPSPPRSGSSLRHRARPAPFSSHARAGPGHGQAADRRPAGAGCGPAGDGRRSLHGRSGPRAAPEEDAREAAPRRATHHLGQLDPAEGAPQVLQVAAEAAQPAALADGLGGGLVGTAGPRDHGGAGRLAVEALQVLAVPHGAGLGAAAPPKGWLSR